MAEYLLGERRETLVQYADIPDYVVIAAILEVARLSWHAVPIRMQATGAHHRDP